MDYQRVSRLLSFTTLFISGCALVGWGFDIPALRGLFYVSAPMNPLTAVCFVLLGCAVLMEGNDPHVRLRSRILGGCVALFCATRLAFYLHGNYSILG